MRRLQLYRKTVVCTLRGGISGRDWPLQRIQKRCAIEDDISYRKSVCIKVIAEVLVLLEVKNPRFTKGGSGFRSVTGASRR
jgi:hypothetical protein